MEKIRIQERFAAMWKKARMESLHIGPRFERNVKPELTTGPLRSLLNVNPTLCHVFFAEVAGKARYLHIVIRASNKHMQTYRPHRCALTPSNHRLILPTARMRKYLLAAVKPLLSPQPLFLFPRSQAKVNRRKNEKRRISRGSLATNKL
jgi:hypothetical protein